MSDEEEKPKGYEFSIAGFKLKLNNTIIAIAIPVMTTIGGAMWGAFEFYKDYMDMKEKIQTYVAPDLTELIKKIEVLEASTNKTVEYSQDIKNDLKADIRRLEGVVESVERDSKVAQRETDKSVQDARRDVRETKTEVDKITRALEKDNMQQSKELQRNVDTAVRSLQKDVEADIKKLRKELDDKIQKALDNPLANK
jgi:hypothetical protein